MHNNSPYFSPFGLGNAVDISTVYPAVEPSGNYYDDNTPIFVMPLPTKPVTTTNIAPTSSTLPATTTNPTVDVISTSTGNTMTFRTVIADKNGIIPANVTIDGKSYANTESGLIQITGVNENSIVTITSVGYKTYSDKASAIPARVVLKEDSNQLPELILTKPPSKKKSIWPWFVAAGIAIAIYRSQQPASKAKLASPIVVKAKI